MDMIMANDPPLPTTVIEEFIMVHLNSNPSVARKVPFDGWSDLELMDRGQFLASLLPQHPPERLLSSMDCWRLSGMVAVAARILQSGGGENPSFDFAFEVGSALG